MANENLVNKMIDGRKRNNYGVIVDDREMSVNDQIDFYLKSGLTFMLHGVSGVGKSRRIADYDPDYTSIVLRNGILPEEIIGKTIYPNNDATKTGVWIAPAWYTSLCEKCEREPGKMHALFIDEITNVKPTEQSLVFHLILNRSIGPNCGKLPKNVVVVAAGNSKQESEAAYNMPEPLFRRFSAHIYLPLNIPDWLEWGSQMRADDHTKTNIHPLVARFVATHGTKIFYTKYDPDEPPKYATDPRGWEQVSDILYANDGVIVKDLIRNKVGKNAAESFMAFAKEPPLTLEEVVSGNYDESDIPNTLDAKYALVLSLRYARPDQLAVVRNFIKDKLNAEMLAKYDVVWVDKNPEKAIFLDNIKKSKNIVKQAEKPKEEKAESDKKPAKILSKEEEKAMKSSLTNLKGLSV